VDDFCMGSFRSALPLLMSNITSKWLLCTRSSRNNGKHQSSIYSSIFVLSRMPHSSSSTCMVASFLIPARHRPVKQKFALLPPIRSSASEIYTNVWNLVRSWLRWDSENFKICFGMRFCFRRQKLFRTRGKVRADYYTVTNRSVT